ncbi:MAG: hypothetical protein GF365_05225 [Candidatus Buchananbacteria bacterium]|nr:hypothetical protein [Candidatus Buchananbacteria bacterium]
MIKLARIFYDDFEEEYFINKIKQLNDDFNHQKFEEIVADFSLRREQQSFTDVVNWLLEQDPARLSIINGILAKLYEEEANLSRQKEIILFARIYALEAQSNFPLYDWSPIINLQIVLNVKERLAHPSTDDDDGEDPFSVKALC